MLGQEHAVAEDVAAHVADTDDGEVVGLRVDAELTEVTLDRLPRATSGDAHALVVIAGRPARGEGVVEPEAVLLRHGVGVVGEACGALVGRDDEVGVVGVVAHDIRGRHDGVADPVVGEVEQARDEDLVRPDALGQPGITVDRRVGQLFGIEAALGAGGHDDGVLDHLGLDQAEDLSAEVFPPIAPPEATAGHLAVAQVDALDPRAVDPDLEHRPGCRQVGHRLRVELEGDVGLRVPVGVPLVEVGAQRRLDDRQQGPDDAVLVEARHGVEGIHDRGGDGRGRLGARLTGLTGIPARVEAGLEEFHEGAGDAGVGHERRLDVVLGELRLGLAEVFGDRPEDDDLAPVEAGLEDERVEAVGLRLAPPHGGEGVLEKGAPMLPVAALAPHAVDRGTQAEVVDVEPDAVPALELVGPLVHDLEPEVGEDRQDGGQRERAATVELEPALVSWGAGLVVHVELDGIVALESFHAPDVGDADARGEVLLERLGEGLAVERRQPRGFLLAMLGAGRLDEVFVPRAGGVDDVTLERREVDVGDLGASRHPQDVVDLRERRLGDSGRVVDALGVEGRPQDAFHAQPDPGVEPVAGQEDQRRHEAPVGVAAEVDLCADAFLLVEHGFGDGDELVGRRLEQLVARVALEHLEQVLARVAVEREPQGRHDGLRPVAEDRDAADRGGVCRGGEQPEEPVLAGDLALIVEGLDADVVEVDRAVDRGPGVGLGHDEQFLVAGMLLDLGAQRRVGRGLGEVVAQQPESGSGHGQEAHLGALLGQRVLAVAEEGEVVGREPRQEAHNLVDLVGGDAGGAVGAQAFGEIGAPSPHLGPVVDRVADVAEDPLELGSDSGTPGGVTDPVNLDVHPRFAGDAERVVADGLIGVEHLDERSRRIAGDDQLRVDQEVDFAAATSQGHRDRVDEEGHVVGDDLDDAVAGAPALGLDRGVVDEDVGRPHRPVACEVEMREGCSQEIFGHPRHEVFGRHVAVIPRQEGLNWNAGLLG